MKYYDVLKRRIHFFNLPLLEKRETFYYYNQLNAMRREWPDFKAHIDLYLNEHRKSQEGEANAPEERKKQESNI